MHIIQARTRSLFLIYRVHYRPMVRPPAPEDVVNGTEDRDRTHNQATVIHRRWRDMLRGGPKDEDPYDEQINASKGIDQYTGKTSDSPRTPGQFAGTAGQVVFFSVHWIDLVRGHYGAGSSSPEK